MGGNLDSNRGDKVILNGEDEAKELQNEDAKLESSRKYEVIEDSNNPLPLNMNSHEK